MEKLCKLYRDEFRDCIFNNDNKKKKKQLNINLNKFYQDFSKILKYILRKDIYKY
jgi:hypothetical protein